MSENQPPPSEPAFDAAAEAKRLLRTIRAGALATRGADGAPFASLVNHATAPDGAPILLLSGLAAHTAHLEGDGRCSLLLAQTGKGDPLAHPRLTVTGVARRDPDPALRERFLRRHPKSALYADFGDFGFWRVAVTAAHLNGGFARAAALGADEILTPIADASDLLAGEAGALDHLNADHADALDLYARLAGEEGAAWRATGLDPDGLDLVAPSGQTHAGRVDLGAGRAVRIAFPEPVNSLGALRGRLVLMAKEARAALGGA